MRIDNSNDVSHTACHVVRQAGVHGRVSCIREPEHSLDLHRILRLHSLRVVHTTGIEQQRIMRDRDKYKTRRRVKRSTGTQVRSSRNWPIPYLRVR